MGTHFTPNALKFLKGLKRNNDRNWFEARRAVYESELKAPMLALIDEVNHAMAGFAPDHVRPAPKVMMRIYRDIRFSSDKRPYKHHVSAWWARRGMEKTSGGGYYLHIAPGEVMISSGCYMPERAQLLAVRRWIADEHATYRKLEKAAIKPRRGEPGPMTVVDHQALSRMPKGFAADHPAGELLRARTWGVHQVLPGEAALDPSLLAHVVAGFKRGTPLIEALNGAMDAGGAEAKTRSLNALF